MATRILSAFLFALITLLAGVEGAQAQARAPRVTDRGKFMIGGSISGSWSKDETDVPWPHLRQWFVSADPSLTYFVVDRVGVGFSLGGAFGRERFDRYLYDLRVREYQVVAGGHAVLEWPFAEPFGLMAIPQASIARVSRDWSVSEHMSAQFQGRNVQVVTALAGEPSRFDAYVLRLSLLVPFVFHASPSVAFGFGPELTYDYALTKDPDTDWTHFGRTVSGLYLGASSWIGVAF